MRGVVAWVFFCGLVCWAATFGAVRGVVHDVQHRPIGGAKVTLQAAHSQWSAAAVTNADGEFTFIQVPVGDYFVSATMPGFEPQRQTVTVESNTTPVLHLELAAATVHLTATVTAPAETAAASTATPTTLVNREDVARTPGADQANSLNIITDFVPGAYMTHDQLHVRGGHQVSWLIDGVPVPNTNIASNVGPQFDPNDIDYLEVQRGGYDADEGDRTYGVFNVVPRTGFESDRQVELVASAGNWGQTNDELSLAGHNQRLAWFASVNGNRSDLGLATPIGQVLHDQENGQGGFASLIFNLDPNDQLRLVTSLRRDFYQIPNTLQQQAAGMHDAQQEADGFVNFSWVRTFNPNTVLTVSPFYHFNQANYVPGPEDYPIATTDDRTSNYAGAQVKFAVTRKKHDLETGFYGFAQHDDQLFGAVFNDQSNPNFQDREPASGTLAEAWVQDRYAPTAWLTLIGGARFSRFDASFTETAASPRLGAALTIPHLHWVLRGFWGKYYQAPPLVTASGPLLQYVTSQSLGFIPLRGERDTEHQFGIDIPWRRWTLDADNFDTRATNFFDHNNVGNSDIFFPLTIAAARIIGWETTVRSPRIANRGQFHLAYSNQIAEGAGAITGGLTDFSPPSGWYLLDHDQRNTLNLGGDIALPAHSFASTNIYYGSGFANGDPPPDHLPAHTTMDLTLGREFSENVSASLTVLNLANRHLLIDNSLTFGGTHYDDPRQIYVELRYRFHY